MECWCQTTILILDGAFAKSHSALTTAFRNVAQKCPTLFRRLLSPGTEKDSDDEADIDTQAIRADDVHLLLEAQSRITLKRLGVGQNEWLKIRYSYHLPFNHPYNRALRRAYVMDYHARHHADIANVWRGKQLYQNNVGITLGIMPVGQSSWKSVIRAVQYCTVL